MVDRVAADRYVTARWRERFGQWRPSLLAVERHRFIPDTIWIENPSDGPPLVALHRQGDQQRWLQRAYGDIAVIAQVDDGDPEAVWWSPTSSASGPVMLCALDAQVGHRVLEIGTGTGYHAALLAHRLGAEQITTIEIGPDMATHARKPCPARGSAPSPWSPATANVVTLRVPRTTEWSPPRSAPPFRTRGSPRPGLAGGSSLRGRTPTSTGPDRADRAR
jgi:hypothetical protein